MMNDGQAKKRNIAPRYKTVRSIPRKRPRLLCAEERTIDVEIEYLVGACTGSGIRSADQIILSEASPQRELDRMVVILACVLQDEVAAESAICRVVDEIVSSVALDIFGFEKNGFRKLAFQGEAPVEEPRSL